MPILPIDEIKATMSNQSNTWFQLESQADNLLTYKTRLHGDPSYDEPGQEDLDEADRLITILRQEFPDLEIETANANEFVRIEIKDKSGYDQAIVLAEQVAKFTPTLEGPNGTFKYWTTDVDYLIYINNKPDVRVRTSWEYTYSDANYPEDTIFDNKTKEEIANPNFRKEYDQFIKLTEADQKSMVDDIESKFPQLAGQVGWGETEDGGATLFVYVAGSLFTPTITSAIKRLNNKINNL